MIKELREKAGFTSVKAFAAVVGISYSRYQLIERMILKATREELAAIGSSDYESYCVEFGCKKTMEYTNRLIAFAKMCGCEKPDEVVKEWCEKNG